MFGEFFLSNIFHIAPERIMKFLISGGLGGGGGGVVSMISYLTGVYFVKISNNMNIFVACRKMKQAFD